MRAARSRRRGAVLLGLFLVAVAAITALAAAGLPSASHEVVAASVPANGIDPLDSSAYNSPVVVASPTDPAVLVAVSRVSAAGRRSTCAVFASGDAGGRWNPTEIPLPAPDSPLPCLSPDLAFGADGTVYLSFATFGPVPGQGTAPDAVWVTTSHDGGRSFSPAVRAVGFLAFQPRLAADPARPGRLWLTWLQATETGSYGLAGTGAPIMVARSDDGGTTWGPPVRVSAEARDRVVAPAIFVADGGGMVVAYLDVGDDRLDYTGAHEGKDGDPYDGRWSLVAARSTDAGASWHESVVDRSVVPTGRFAMLNPAPPALTGERDGRRVYLGFHDGRAGDPDVMVWASNDGGRRWAGGRRVNDTVRRDGTTQQLAHLAVAADGRLDVVYYDRRGDHRNDVQTEVSLQSSFDGGRSFTRHLALSDRPFDSRIGPGPAGGLANLGDRLGLVSTDRGVLAMWTDTRAGLSTTGKQDLARAVASVAEGSSLRVPLRSGAVGIGALGVGLFIFGLAVPRRREPAEGGGVAGWEAPPPSGGG